MTTLINKFKNILLHKEIGVFILFLFATFLSLIIVRDGHKTRFVLTKADYRDFAEAIRGQDKSYDINHDGSVTGEDINLILDKKPTRHLVSSSQRNNETEIDGIVLENTLSLTAETATSGYLGLPSMRGISSDLFTGSVTSSFSFELPEGRGGMMPAISLSYSSGSVDDQYTGILTKWRNDAEHPYQSQAGIFGLGWSLNGISSIIRNTQGTLNYESDDTFIINSGAGSANLIPESGNYGWNEEGYSIWRTAPNLKMKVERVQHCNTISSDPEAYPNGIRFVCRAQWTATDENGTKFTFGYDAVDYWHRTKDPDNNFPEGEGKSWFPLYNDVDGKIEGASEWLLNGGNIDFWGGLHSTTTRWLLTKTESVLSTPAQPLNIGYKYNFQLGEYSKGEETKSYVRISYPLAIEYFPHRVDFFVDYPVGRWDYKIHQGENATPDQPQTATYRIKKVLISTANQAIRTYIFNYKYGYDRNKHPDKNRNGTLDSDEVISGQVIHSLLESITPYSGDKSL